KKLTVRTLVFSLVIIALLVGIAFMMYINNIRLGFSLNGVDWTFSLIILIVCVASYFFISRKYDEIKNGLKLIFLIFLFSGISVYLFSAKFENAKDYQTVISLYVSSLVICAGWWIQSAVSRASARKQHTLNLVVNHRFSELFHKKNESAFDVFGVDKTIHPDWVKKSFSSKGDEIDDEGKKYITGTLGLSYLLNFYEFVSVGIIQKDLDEGMIKECFLGIMSRLEKRGVFLIRYSQRIEPKAYENLVALIERWGREPLTKKYASIENDYELIANPGFIKDIEVLSDGFKQKKS
ncbi:DUF4760 domain-containing protein, partial [Salmonella enterica]|nr:DUF4760 domain-containing protein [Salmonella enterica]